jgi:diaminopimelate epimerase
MTSPHTVVVPFVKASACGNDFLIIDSEQAPPDIVAFTRRICDRHDGVGADGVEWLFPTKEADVQARLLNADGSEAEISGNGTRCVAAYLVSENHKEKITILTGAGLKTCTLTSHREMQFEFEIAMGQPQVSDELAVRLVSGPVHGIPVSMGNPHFVVFVDDFAPVWQAEAAEIQRDRQFQHGVNVEFVAVKHLHEIEARFFERGVGETQSSGTGSCASAVAAIAAGKTQSPVRVHTPGGTQTVRWDQQVYLRGNAQLICRGEFFV